MSSCVSKKMVQYSVWPNCNNNCKFCLRKERLPYSYEQQVQSIQNICSNIQHIDWTQYPYGVSLLGGELYNIKDARLQSMFLQLVNCIIDDVIMPLDNDECKISSVTNGIYDPSFLFTVADLIKSKVGIKHLDVNFSYDIKYRYSSECARKQVINNINAFHDRYDYRVGVQMILTQYVIDAVKTGKFDIRAFVDENIPGNIITFLYPHPIATGHALHDFNFKRSDFLHFLNYLRSYNYEMFLNFIYSTRNSSTFKYTGLRERKKIFNIDCNQQPVLSDGKETISPECGHSVLYRCYADSDKCVLCDILKFDNTIR